LRKKQGPKVSRRVFKRFRANFPITFMDLKQGKEIDAETKDVSAKGLGIFTYTEVEKYTPLKIWVYMPDRQKPFYTQGRIAWVDPLENGFRAGVTLDKPEFMGLSRIFRSRIN